jgi:putative resolvase
VKLNQYAKQQGISYSTALRWWHQGAIRGYQAPSGTIIVETERKQAEPGARIAIYACVTSAEHKAEPLKWSIQQKITQKTCFTM